jgi:hypothetical protein
MMEDDPLDDFAREITLEQITKRVYVSDSAIPSCRLNVRFTPDKQTSTGAIRRSA